MQSAITSYSTVIEPSLDLSLDLFALQNIDIFDVTGLDSSERDDLLAMFFGSSSRSLVVCKDGDVLSFYQVQSPLPEESDNSHRLSTVSDFFRGIWQISFPRLPLFSCNIALTLSHYQGTIFAATSFFVAGFA